MSPSQRHHVRQGRPNRRFRRLVPAVAASAALLAAGVPAGALAKSNADPRPVARPASRQQAVVPRPPRDAASDRTGSGA
jgi:hypothetical protein